MKDYNPEKIEKKWQKEWAKKKVFSASDTSKNKKYYPLVEFPYPSGQGLHTGHVRGYTAMDIIARKRRAEGYNVLYPIGWDAFGLPTENYALKTGIAPEKVTKQNTDVFRQQLQSLGFSFDWSREINTTDPKYYKWTQWIFLKLLENGLAYKDKMAINWCPKDKIGLANEEVVNGKCERCGTPVEKREKEQWMLRITKYAERLEKDLDTVDYLEKIKLQQRNWIGRSDGALIKFALVATRTDADMTRTDAEKIQRGSAFVQRGSATSIEVFTTRPDTLFGATYVVLAPEHEFVAELLRNNEYGIKNKEEIQKYVGEAKKKQEMERTADEKEKTGVKLDGVVAINPANGEEIPVFIADYVLSTYGTGAVMAVPAHDERDFVFAKKYGLPIRHVVIPTIIDKKFPPVEGQEFVARHTIHAIVRNPKTGAYLCLNWKKFPWTTFIVGGIEDGEDPIEAAKREVAEETGYTNIQFVRFLDGPVRAQYNAAHKKQNRTAYTRGILFDLVGEERQPITEEEADAFDTEWLKFEEITPARMTCAELLEWLDRIPAEEKAYLGSGVLFESGKFSDMDSEKAKKEIVKAVGGKWVTKFKLRDWVFSRQRYWGEPIPLVFCEHCATRTNADKHADKRRQNSNQTWLDQNPGWVPVPEKDLPLKLPKVKKYEPTDTGESPLASISSWVNTKCPKCGGKARRETDTMPQWAGSSWYYLAYTSRGISNFQFPISNGKSESKTEKSLKYWMPVDWYNGGMEHTTLHLLYSRFWNKFLFDIGVSPVSEPYKKRTSHGFILASNNEKMSKSRGNVVNPDDIVKTYGADTLRVYEMFMGPFDQAISWGEENIIGVRRFLEKVWRVGERVSRTTLDTDQYRKFETLLHKTIKKVSEDIESMGFNTAISAMMILASAMEKLDSIPREDFEKFLIILSPFAPHVAEELWNALGNKKMIATAEWPKADAKKIKETELKIVIQVNSKVRAELMAPLNASESEIFEKATALPEVKKWLEGKEVKKRVYVPGRLVNFVVA